MGGAAEMRDGTAAGPGAAAGQDAGRPGSVRPQRADARRNVAAILDAALECLARNPQASTTDIARAAGVGRVTLYGHFPSRADLVDAAFARALQQASATLEAVDLSGDPRDALTRLIASSWQVVDRHQVLLGVADAELPPERIRAYHNEPMRRVHALIAAGQRSGAFRDDLPADWLVAVFYAVMHGAAAEIRAGRLGAADAVGVITTTLLAVYARPVNPVA
jgi:TetR/AcrR family transcriptional regulator, mexCD-oprJ operon repressor